MGDGPDDPPGTGDADESAPNWSSGAGAAPDAGAPRVPDGARYEPLGLIGAGGMGLVHAVYDTVLGRDVARKRARPGDPAGAEALRREAALAAGLEHPGIVPVYDVGDDGDGEPWYTMRLVRGRTLRERIKEAEQPLLLLRSLLGAAEAVAYAHARDVVHCDLKSSNVMLGEHGEVQVADWGLASSGGRGRGGTPRCMSPEQAAGAAATPRSDVWGLGLMLLELCGGPPGLDEGQRERLVEEPARAVFSGALGGAPPELVAVIERCLAHDPERRYRDAGEFADELARFLDGRLVGAHAYTLGELVRRWYRRHARVVQVASVLLAALVAVVAAAWVRTAQESVAARKAEADAVRAEARATDHLAEALILAARGAAKVHARPEAEVLAANALALTESPQARGALMAFGDSPAPARSAVDRSPCRSERRDPHGDRRLCLDDGRLRSIEGGWSVELDAEDAAFAGEFVVATDASLRAHVFSPAGVALGVTEALVSPVSLVSGATRAHLARADVLETVDPQTRAVLRRVPCGTESIGSLVEMRDGRLAIVCAYAGLGLYDPVHDVMESLPVSLPDVGGSFRNIAASRDGALALANDRGQLLIVPAAGPTVQRTLPCAVTDLLWTDDASRLLASCRRGGAAVLDGRSAVSLGRLPARSGADFDAHGPSGVVSPDGERWELGALRPARFGGAVGLSAVLAQEGHLVLGGGDGAVVRVRTRDGAETARVMPDRRTVKDLVSLPGGDVLVLGAGAGTWRMRADLSGAAHWNPATGRRVLVLGEDVLVSEYWPFWSRLAGSGEVLARVPLGERPLRDASSSADGTWAVGVTEEGRVLRLEQRGTEVQELAQFADASAVVALPGGVTAVARDGALVLLEGAQQRTVPVEGQQALALAASEDGELLAVAALDGVVQLLDRDGVVLAVLEGHEERVVDVEFFGDLLVTASWDTTARLWDLRRLRAPADELVARAEEAWGLTMEEALAARTW